MNCAHWHHVVPAAVTVADPGVDEAVSADRRWAEVGDGVWLVDTGSDAGRGVDGYVEGVRRVLRRLANRARAGELALFLGAGVSMSAGLPSRDGLLERLGELVAARYGVG